MNRTRLRLAACATAALVTVVGGGEAGAAAAGNPPMRVAPYVDMGLLSNGAATLTELAGRSFSLGYVTGADCRATWFNAFDPRAGEFAGQISAVRANGGDVKVSFGGASGVELAQGCTDVAALQAEYQAVVSTYDLRHIDLDIEGAAVADPEAIDRRSAALRGLQEANPGLRISLTLPVLPEGLTEDGLNVLRSARDAGVDVDLINIMAMDYGRPTQDYGDLTIRAARATKDQIKIVYGVNDATAFGMLGVTPMIGMNDDRGIFTLADAADLVAFANANRLGFLSYAEANRDRNACVGALFQCTNVNQTPHAFSKVFALFPE